MYVINEFVKEDEREKKNMREYKIVEREFLGKVSTEEVVARILESKLKAQKIIDLMR